MAILGLAALVHRSEQTANQIYLAETQVVMMDAKNNFENFYNHRRLFIEHLERYRCENEVFRICSPEKLYHSLFPDNSSFKFHPEISQDAMNSDVINWVRSQRRCVEYYHLARQDAGHIEQLLDYHTWLVRSFESVRLNSGVQVSYRHVEYGFPCAGCSEVGIFTNEIGRFIDYVLGFCIQSDKPLSYNTARISYLEPDYGLDHELERIIADYAKKPD